jgi:hypothetical protein
MEPGQPHNMAIAEVEHNGRIGRITGTAVTENDDAIQFIVDLMAKEGISGDKVLSLYSERKPSPEWYEYFEKHWPNVAVTWSFGPGEDARMEAEVEKLLTKRAKPWWKLW